MLILPAIDILGGQCVRLYKGEYNTAKKVAEDAFLTVERFISDGAEYLHLVDLDGAKSGEKINSELFCSIAKKYDIPIELGGGIRNLDTIKFYLENGIARVILGSAAVRDQSLLEKALEIYGNERIVVGIDSKDGYVGISGWTEISGIPYLSFAQKMQDIGVKNIIVTDIDCDGTLGGPNFDMLDDLSLNTSLDITASGGIKDIDDIKALHKRNLYAAIVGISIYDGTLDLKEAISCCKK